MIDCLKTMLEETGLPVAYSHFKKAPKLPYICFYRNQKTTSGSDYGNEINDESYLIELYSVKKDVDAESKIEDVLTKYGISYFVNELYIDTENMYCCIFDIELYYKKEWAQCQQKKELLTNRKLP